MKELNWAVLGVGVIANEMAQAFERENRRLYGVWSRTWERAVDYGKKYGVSRVYRSLEELCQDEQVDVVYVATPHNTHYELIRQALLHGKHVLAEKAITLNSRELNGLKALAQERGLILAEAMTVWHMPLYKKLWELVDSGRLGKPQIITMNFGSFKEYDMTNRFFNLELAGGAMLDIGVYALSVVRGFLEAAPDQVVSQRRASPTGSDEQAGLLLMNEAGQMATVALSMHSRQPKRAMISCERAYIEIMDYPRASRAVIVDAVTGAQEVIEAGETGKALFYEAEDMEEAVRSKDASPMRLSYSCDVMDIMTKVRKDWEMRYPGEVW